MTTKTRRKALTTFMFTPEEIDEICYQYSQGHSAAELGKRYGCCGDTILNTVKRRYKEDYEKNQAKQTATNND
jgi:Mor family transcriptional regulator